MKKNFVWSAAALLALAVLAQFFRPERTNPPIDSAMTVLSDTTVPPPVRAVFRRSCFDCHSNETVWPWYSEITPVNFLVAGDVATGRKNLNFSEWGRQKLGRRMSVLEEIGDQLTGRDMPLKKYLLMHPNAKVSDDEIKMISDWCDAEQKRLSSAPDSAPPLQKK